MSDLDHRLASWLLANKLLPEHTLRRALEAPRSHSEDLCDILIKHGQLPPELATQARQAVGQGRAGASSRQALQHSQAQPDSNPATDNRAQLASRFATLYPRDPLFAPHAELAFKRGELLGEGGMGQVFRIVDERLGRDAALKLLHNHDITPRLIKRFLREARITARLDHPSIPPVYEAGITAQGEHYMLMRLIGGHTLESLIDEPQTSQRQLLEILLKVSEAVAYAHNRGIMHRDLKPSNVMVGDFGEVMVMDWGLAKDLNDQEPEDLIAPSVSAEELAGAGLTINGSIIGTPGYMSPEQAGGEAHDLSTDLFSLGAILTEALTHQPPVGGESALQRVISTLEGNISTPRDLDPSIPRELDLIARQALSEHPSQRQSSAEFANQLRCYLAGQDVPGYPYSTTERLTRFARQRPLQLVTGAIVASLLIVALSLQQSLSKVQFSRDLARQAEERSTRVLDAMSQAEALAARGQHGPELTKAIAEALQQGRRSQGLLLRCARLYMEVHDHPQARLLLEETISKHPPAYSALLTLHNLQLARNTNSAAQFRMTRALQKLVARAQEDPTTNEFTLYAKALNQLHLPARLPQTIKLLDQAIERNPAFAKAYEVRACAHAAHNQIDAALEDADRALQLDPFATFPAMLRWTLFSHRREYQRALDEVNRVIRRAPGNSTFVRQRGILHMALNKPQAARDDAIRALKIDPHDPFNWNFRARIHARDGEITEAENALTRSLAIDPKIADTYYRRAQLRFNKRENSSRSVIDDCERALALNPKLSAAHKLKSLARQRLKNPTPKPLQKPQPSTSNPKKNYQRARVAYRARNFHEALRLLNAVIKARPRHKAALRLRSKTLSALKRPQEALNDLTRLCKLAPNNAEFAGERGVALIQAGRFHDGISTIDAHIDRHCDAQILLARAMAYQQTGQNKKAIADLERSLNDYPKLPKPIRQTIQATIQRLSQSPGQ